MERQGFIIAAGIIFVLMASGCIQDGEDDGKINVTNETLFIEIGDTIPEAECSERGIEGNVIIIHKTGCPACAATLPKLRELETELGMAFEYYDAAVTSELNSLMEKYNILPYHVPSVIINCIVYGPKEKEEYRSLLG